MSPLLRTLSRFLLGLLLTLHVAGPRSAEAYEILMLDDDPVVLEVHPGKAWLAGSGLALAGGAVGLVGGVALAAAMGTDCGYLCLDGEQFAALWVAPALGLALGAATGVALVGDYRWRPAFAGAIGMAMLWPVALVAGGVYGIAGAVALTVGGSVFLATREVRRRQRRLEAALLTTPGGRTVPGVALSGNF